MKKKTIHDLRHLSFHNMVVYECLRYHEAHPEEISMADTLIAMVFILSEQNDALIKKHIDDAKIYGEAFMKDGKRIDPNHMILPFDRIDCFRHGQQVADSYGNCPLCESVKTKGITEG